MSKTPEQSLRIGTVLNDKWVILESIGRGGMGEVYRAHQLNLKRDVAIKIISREWLESLEDDEEELLSGLQRFRNEMQTMAQVRHPNVLSIFDYGSISVKGSKGEIPLEYIAMEYVPGGTLRSTMSEEGFYPEEKLVREWLRDFFLPVLEGLEALHGAGMVHRDIKPENILMDGKTPKIADFGLARSSAMKPLTQSADMKGTPGYMPPEQFIDFRRTDERADVYALGKILYEAVDGKMKAGTIPFRKAKLRNPEPAFFKNLDRIIKKATEEDKNGRLVSVQAMQEELSKVLRAPAAGDVVPAPEDRTREKTGLGLFSASRKWSWGGAVLLLVSVGVAALFFTTKPAQFETKPGVESGLHQQAQKTGTVAGKGVTENGKTLHGEDGANLYLVPGGTVTLPGKESGQAPSTVESFYMDETPVTNYQFVAFLNQVLKDIRVEQGVVRGNGNIWFFLGEAREGYEPIMYRNGRFHVNKPAISAWPVIRVTGYGASAYARFYHRRLPTATEWAYAVSKGAPDSAVPSTVLVGKDKAEPTSDGMDQMMKSMHGETTADHEHSPGEKPMAPLESVTLSKPNAFGIRGLNAGLSEWGVRKTDGQSGKDKGMKEYVVLGGLGSRPGKASALPAPLIRKPWEAFEEVGFRTVRSAGLG